MNTHSTDVALRPFAPTDGPAIAELFEQTPDAGQIRFTTRFKADAYTALTALHVERLPLAMKLVVRAMGLLPPSGVVDEVLVDQLWFGPGQLAAAQALWAWLRWEIRERGSVLRTAYDPRSPLAAALRLPIWQPRAPSSFAVRAPVPIDPARLLYPYS